LRHQINVIGIEIDPVTQMRALRLTINKNLDKGYFFEAIKQIQTLELLVETSKLLDIQIPQKVIDFLASETVSRTKTTNERVSAYRVGY